MPGRRGFRFALEVVFLTALAGALSFGSLGAVTIGLLMLLGWLIVALLEWIAWRGEAHYGRGLPPRYYVPRISLPDPAPLEQAWRGYPEPEDSGDAPTWVASPALRTEVLGAWPVAVRVADDPEPEVPEVVAPEFDPVLLLAPRAAEAETARAKPAERVRLERHRIDPLREHDRTRRPWHRAEDDDADVTTVPARPEGLRTLPLRQTRED